MRAQSFLQIFKQNNTIQYQEVKCRIFNQFTSSGDAKLSVALLVSTGRNRNQFNHELSQQKSNWNSEKKTAEEKSVDVKVGVFRLLAQSYLIFRPVLGLSVVILIL